MTRWLLVLFVPVFGLFSTALRAADEKAGGILIMPTTPDAGMVLAPEAESPFLPSALWWLKLVPIQRATFYVLRDIMPTVIYSVARFPKGTRVPKVVGAERFEKFDLLLAALPDGTAYLTTCDVFIGYRFDSATDRMPAKNPLELSEETLRLTASTWTFVHARTNALKQNLITVEVFRPEAAAVIVSFEQLDRLMPPPERRRSPQQRKTT